MVNRRKLIEERIKIINLVRTDVTSYQAEYDKHGYVIRGITSNDANVKYIVSKMINARYDPPESVLSVVPTMVGYIELMVNNGAWHISTTVAVDAVDGEKKDGEIVVTAVLNHCSDYEGEGGEDAQWHVKLSVAFHGFDGFYEDAVHEVSFTYRTQQLDYEALGSLLRTLIKIAYNAHARLPISAFIR
jgi:hypothetical protein